jgi:hypothetical protein
MKKTIATVALLAASTPSFAIMGPGLGEDVKPKTICLRLGSYQDGSKAVSDCDESANNVQLKKTIKANGCAAGQAALVTYDNVNIGLCMPPGVVQL